MYDKNRNEPAYSKIYNELKRRIIKGKYPVGTLLPPEPRLCEEFFVSRTTVRKAISLLASDGLISVRQGFGTKVLEQRIMQSLDTITSISQTLEQRGYKIGTQNMYIQIVQCPDEMADILDISHSDKIAVINRIQTADDLPVAISKNYIPYCMVAGIENETENIISLYKYLEKNYNMKITGMKNTIGAMNAGFEDAGLLQIKPGAALITVKRVCYIHNKPSEVDDVKIIADKYAYEIYMHN